MQSELKIYQKHIILAKLFKLLPFTLLIIVMVSILTLYLSSLIYAFSSFVFSLAIVCGLARLYFLKESASFKNIVKNLDSDFGNNDMIQTVMELNAPDDSLVQQELFEQAQIKLQPIYKKAAATHLAEKDKGTKMGGLSLIVYLLICLLAFVFSSVSQPPNSKKSSKSENSQSKKNSSNQSSSSKSPSNQGSKKGGDKSKGGGKGKSKATKSKNSNKSSGKAKAGSKSKNSGKKTPTANNIKKSPGKTSKLKVQKAKSSPQKAKTKKKKGPSKTSPKKSKDWQKASKGKWDKNSKGRSLGTGKVKDPLMDKRVLSAANYQNSGEKLLTGVKKMTIPQKYKDKILKIHEELRRSSKNSKNVYYPSKGYR
ncbi:MAG: hypothetical protein KC646_17845 [Candidatus Cloacimonetes bacterium]|nr:hypothetical protein [Candidatus Cloacimonadota bacterium]